MKFLAVVAPLLLSASALAIWGDKQQQSSLILEEGDKKIPGVSPLEHCSADFGGDILTLEHVNLNPNPPLAGKTLTIEAIGTFKEDIGKGAYVVLQVKYGLIKLLSTTADLCEQIKEVDMECPIKAGETKITKEVDLPAQIPPGKYTVTADVFTEDDRQITCLSATVQFKGSFGAFELV
ncbi:hypothetical protein V499_06528 [Pseudogymnoascus sp. VKM F-103]|uniref:Phosphatidylglycerol/phosphatidylinositol transfer protein n=1 Tax=Pseudogymnoascus verrucosus TaxID=342668 RepID=A0A1B8GGR7_9PEZI|nr:sterol transporter [Pseudogymnoascus verrucosus]KFY73383.1 hypothetical protein V499_06528 [Pseudogymnoascus sp. VKM F-103]OBT95010.1 sterol transporter [Pseudogymnoascus verrucosus]